MVQPRHLLPVHGEFAFLCAHAELSHCRSLPLSLFSPSPSSPSAFPLSPLPPRDLTPKYLCVPRGELEEVLKMVQPRHFLPVHGEFAFLCAHAELARDCGMPSTHVIRNGQMLGVSDMRNKNVVSQSGLLGQANLNLFYNDGNKVRGHVCRGETY
jgi:mRNA degradation ribonuclease J1/J2